MNPAKANAQIKLWRLDGCQGPAPELATQYINEKDKMNSEPTFHVSDLWHLNPRDIARSLLSTVPVNGTVVEQDLINALEAYVKESQ